MKASLKTPILFLAVVATAVCVRAQSTAFTYHGVLNRNRVPVTGEYDMRFAVYDANLGGTLIAGPLPLNAVDVTNGLFTARIDFMNGVFTGPARWMEVSVRPAGNGAFETLSPRQELTSSPYSIRAREAAMLPDGALTASQLRVAGGAPTSGQVLGFNGTDLFWTGGGSPGVWSMNGSSAYYNGGNVGVGTTDPTTKLTVQTVAGQYGVEHTDGARRLSTYVSATGGWFGTRSADPLHFYVNDGGARMTVDAVGNIGIGTPSPLANLHVLNPTDSATCLIDSGGGVNAWSKVGFRNANGQWHIGTSRSFNNDVFYIDRLGNSSLEFQLSTSGSLGLGIEPQRNLHIFDPNNSVSARVQTGGGVNAWTRLEFVNANGQWDIGTSRSFNGDQLYFYRQGAPGIALGIQPNGDAYLDGRLTCKVLTITGGADIAEPFKMTSGSIPRGSVVVIDEQNPGHLKLSTEAYDTRVAGVVSGANGISPGIALKQEGALEGGENVALSGRVYVQADASFGAVKPGDLLTTSDTPGHAMKVRDHAKAQGAVLGKAMNALKEGKGMVLVLVTLQ